jgi:carbon-monoxide dehydrogenase iron sulfur subunit
MAQHLNIEVNTPKCTGCRLCEIVCSVHHEGAVNLTKARIRVSDSYEESLFLPHVCQLCEPAPCVEACPAQALTRDFQTGIISVDDALCSGCQLCEEACPYQAIWWEKSLGRLFVCDRCNGRPVCLEFCTTGALKGQG